MLRINDFLSYLETSDRPAMINVISSMPSLILETRALSEDDYKNLVEQIPARFPDSETAELLVKIFRAMR